MNTVIDQIELRTVAPRRPLPGLDEATRKLEGLSASIKRVQAQLAGLSANTAFKLSARQYSALAYNARGLPQLNVMQMARRIGLPDTRDVKEYARTVEAQLQSSIGALQRRLENNPALGKRARANLRTQIRTLQSQSFFTDPSVRTFRNPTQAGRFFEQYASAALKDKQKGEAALRAILMGTTPMVPMPGRGSAPGMGLMKVQGPPAPGTKGGAPAMPAIAPPSRKKAKTTEDTVLVDDGSGGLVQTKVIKTPRAQREMATRRTGAGQTMETVREGGEVLRTTTTTRIEERLRKQFRTGLSEIGSAYAADLPAMSGNAANLRKLREQAVRQARALYFSNPEFSQLGFREPLAEFTGGSGLGSGVLGKLQQREIVRQSKQQRRMMLLRQRAARQADSQSAKQAAAELKLIEADQAKREANFGRMEALKQPKVQSHESTAQARLAMEDWATNQKLQSLEAVREAERQIQKRGALPVSVQRDFLTGRTMGAQYQLREGDTLHTFNVNYEKAGGSVQHLRKEMNLVGREAEVLGSNWLRNTAKVAAWTSSLGVLYTGLDLVRHSFSELLEVSGQYARLDQTFKHVGGSTRELTDDILRLAAANGRGAQEAMDSAIEWARFGLTRTQVMEAVKVSAMAANVSELTMAETTDHLQQVMQAYGLRVGQLRTVLGMLNQTALSYNVTNAQLLGSLAQTAVAAKSTGMGLAELIGVSGALGGSTGQSGAVLGSTIKFIIGSLTNPARQQQLRSGFRFEVTTNGVDVKNFSKLLGDLYVKYERLNDTQRNSILYMIGQRWQMNRLGAMLDGYMRSQALAVNMQLNLNTAEEENTRIKAALRTQLMGLRTEWERFVVAQGNNGPAQALGAITEAMRHLLEVMNSPQGSLMTSLLLGMSTAAMGKTLLTGMAMKGAIRGGFMGRSVRAVGQSAAAVSSWADAAVLSFMANNMTGPRSLARDIRGYAGYGLMRFNDFGRDRMAAGWLGFEKGATLGARALAPFNLALGGTVRLLAVASVALAEWFVPIAAVAGVIWGVNKAFDYFQGNVEKSEEKLAGFNQEMDAAAAKASAAATAVNLFTRASQVLPTLRPAESEKFFGAVSSAAFPWITGEKERQKAQEDALSRWRSGFASGQTAGIQQDFIGQIQGARDMNRRQLLEQHKEQQKAIEEYQSQIGRWQGLNRGFFATKYDTAKRNEKILEYQKRIEEQKAASTGTVMQMIDDAAGQEDDYEAALSHTQRYQSEKEKQSARMTAIGEMFQQMPTANPLQQAQLEIAGRQAQIAALEHYQETLEAVDQQEEAHNTEREKGLELARQEEQSLMAQVAAKQAVIDADNKLLDANHKSVWGTMTPDKNDAMEREVHDYTSAVAALNGQLDQNRTKQQDLGTQQTATQKLSQVRRRETEEDLLALRAKQDAAYANLDIARTRTVMGYAGQRAEVEASGQRYGLNDSAKLLRQTKFLMDEVVRLQNQDKLDASDTARFLKDRVLLEQNLLELRQRHADVEREIKQLAIDQNREFTRSFFGAGPAEMLRKLAAFRMSQGGTEPRPGTISQGQFFSLGPAMRQDYGMLNPQYNPEMIFLKQELALLDQFIGKLSGIGGKGKGEDPWGDFFDRMLVKMGERLDAGLGRMSEAVMKSLMPDVALVQNASDALTGLKDAATQAAEALARIAALAPGGAPAPAARVPSGFHPEPAGQTGGWYPGKQSFLPGLPSITDMLGL